MKKIILPLIAAIMAVSCIDEPYVPDEPIDTATHTSGPRALVLCEGSWGSNDASLASLYTDNGTMDNEWFEIANGRGLGDVAQDMLLVGPKAYVTVTFSNTLEVVDTATGQSARHTMGELHPRYLAADDTRLFVSCYGGHQVVVYNLSDLDHPVANLPLGNFQPEGLAIVGGRLFVASSWIQYQNQNYDYDSTVYIFDLSDYSLVGTVTVGLNPQMVVALDDSHVAVNYSGNYGSTSAGCAIIDASTLEVSQLGRSATGMSAAGGVLYGFSRQGYSSSATATYWRYDGNSFTDIPVGVNTPYSISAGTDGHIYVTTDGNYIAAGDVLCLTTDGTLLWRSEAGILPKKVITLR